MAVGLGGQIFSSPRGGGHSPISPSPDATAHANPSPDWTAYTTAGRAEDVDTRYEPPPLGGSATPNFFSIGSGVLGF